jgi:hypothetical protein
VGKHLSTSQPQFDALETLLVGLWSEEHIFGEPNITVGGESKEKSSKTVSTDTYNSGLYLLPQAVLQPLRHLPIIPPENITLCTVIDQVKFGPVTNELHLSIAGRIGVIFPSGKGTGSNNSPLSKRLEKERQGLDTNILPPVLGFYVKLLYVKDVVSRKHSLFEDSGNPSNLS